MSELGDSNGPVRRDEAHEQWLAMQSAYEEYVRVSEVFENSGESIRDSADPACRDLMLLDCRQDAFGRYVEARMEYLERRYDESYRREAAIAAQSTRGRGGFRTFFRLAGPQWAIIPVLAVGMLSATTFSVVREQKRVRDLDSARDQLQAGLSDTREELQLLRNKLNAWESSERSAVRQVEHTEQPPAPAPQVDGRKPSEAPQQPVPARTPKTTSRNVAVGYFSLSRSSQLKRVGPIKMSLKDVDMRRNSVDVSIVSEAGAMNVRLRLNQPVRFKGSNRGQPMELVVDRITSDGLSGHLIEFYG